MNGNDELELIAYEKICKIIRDRINGDILLTRETTSDDLRMDSLDNVELVLYLEEEFNIDIIDEVWEKCNTIGDIHTLVLSCKPTINIPPPERKDIEEVACGKRWSWGGWW
ncbi:putative Acyl carrier protein [Vibrio phage 249E41-1]|nr:putative Acyl carrier protein [Vibrio phage 249E41-1]